MSIARNAALLSANFVAAILCISLNRETFKSFPFPAALTTLHYAVAAIAIEFVHVAGGFEKRPVPLTQRHNFYLLVCCWSACNALSNVSLDRNSVGFYQLVKILVTPSLVAFDFVVYGRRTTLLQGVALVLACLGVGVASVDDVQVNAYGALIACSAVITAAAQKVLNMHVQQVGGLSALQVLSNALPAMTLLSLAYVPLLDRDLPHLATCDWVRFSRQTEMKIGISRCGRHTVEIQTSSVDVQRYSLHAPHRSSLATLHHPSHLPLPRQA